LLRVMTPSARLPAATGTNEPSPAIVRSRGAMSSKIRLTFHPPEVFNIA
jgi:hypothetical protein